MAQHLRQLSLAELAGSTRAVAEARQPWRAGVCIEHRIVTPFLFGSTGLEHTLAACSNVGAPWR
jgi:hypothetical protein